MGGYSSKFETRIDLRNLKVLQLDGHMELEKALYFVCNPTSFGGWVIAGYSSDKTIKLQSYGKGGVSELATHFKDNEVQYAILRTEIGGDESHKTRDIFISWWGPKVSNLQKGIKRTHDADVKIIFRPFHADIHVTSKDHFTLDEVLKKSNPLSGSHQID